MALYEFVALLRQDLSSLQVENQMAESRAILEEGGAGIPKEEYWGLRNLAYKIRKNRKAHYFLFNVDGPPEAVQELERRLSISEDVLRFLTVKVEAFEEGPSAPMRLRTERGESETRPSSRSTESREKEESSDSGKKSEKAPEKESKEAPESPQTNKKADKEKEKETAT